MAGTWKTINEIAAHNAGVVSRADLARAGLSDSTIERYCRDGRLARVGRGVYRIAGVRPTFESEVIAALEPFGPDTWAARYTAARVDDLGVEGRERRIELLRPIDTSAARSGIVVHRSGTILPHHVKVVRGIALTATARTIFDIAATTGSVQLGRAIDRALLAGKCTMPGLYRVLYELGGRGRPGTRRFRTAVDVRGLDHVPPESDLEAVGMALLEGMGFEWQVPMSDEQGYIRRVDGRHADARLVIEFDGRQHDVGDARALDADHDARLRALGWDVLRLRWPDVSRDGDATRLAVARRVLPRPAA